MLNIVKKYFRLNDTTQIFVPWRGSLNDGWETGVKEYVDNYKEMVKLIDKLNDGWETDVKENKVNKVIFQ